MKEFAIIRVPAAFVYGSTEKTEQNEDGLTVSNVSDEALYGAVCRVLEEREGMVHILSHYGYAGWIDAEALLPVTEAEAKAWLARELMVVDTVCLDVMNVPKVQGVPLIALPKGAQLAVAPREEWQNGWASVTLADGRAGYVTAVHLREKRFGEDYLWTDPAPVLENLTHVKERRKTETGGREGFSLQAVLDRYYGGSEDAFRTELTGTAKSYLGVQYRWSGRSSYGVDCSGLVSVCYMLNGVLIYRDASLVRGYAMKRLALQWDEEGHFVQDNLNAMKPGDALYFPGHIAMYLGNGEYIHSTGRAGDNGVVINSLVPGAPGYREDLLRLMYAVGGVRTE